jgi:hypothetical protein
MVFNQVSYYLHTKGFRKGDFINFEINPNESAAGLEEPTVN